MRSQRFIIYVAGCFLVGAAIGFSPSHIPVRHQNCCSKQSALPMVGNNNNNSNKEFPIGSVILALLGAQSAYDLLTEVPNVIASLGGGNSGQPPDYLGTAFDIGFAGYAVKVLIDQVFGGIQSEAGASSSFLAGFECGVTLNVGREPGTWMDNKWGASGARLMLPLNVCFTDQQLDLGIPGEEALGGRFCNRLDVEQESAKFVGPAGETQVPVVGGGWSASPFAGAMAGEYKLRFFLDFPAGASRNDVTLPAGRVFFSGSCFSDVSAAKLSPGEQIRVVEVPGGAGIYNEGGMNIKKNGILNLYGAFGDTNLILGRFVLGNTIKR